MTEKTSSINPTALTAAMMTTEEDVPMPSRVHAGSITGGLIALKKGAVYTVSREIPAEETLASVADSIDARRASVRSSINACVRNASKHHGQKFSMESALVSYPSGRMFVQVTVTCVDDGGDK